MYPWYPNYWPMAYPWAPCMPPPQTQQHSIPPTWPYQQANTYRHPYTMPPAPHGSGGHLTGGHDPASTYMFLTDHTKIKVILGEAWTPATGADHRGPQFTYYNVPLVMTVNEFIGHAGGQEEWVMTELYERGGGEFMTGIEITEGSAKSKKTLQEYGFGRENVFVWIHKP